MKRIAKLSFFLLLVAGAGIWNGAASVNPGQDPQEEIRHLTVQEAVQMALSGSPEMLLAESQTIRAGEAVRESRSLNRPQVVTGTGLAYNNGFPLSIEGAAPSIFQIGLSQSIFSKKNNNLIREAKEAGKASGFNKESMRNELASRTASAYFKLHQARKMIVLAAEILESAKTQQEMTESLFQAGKARPVDVTSAKTAVSAARQQLLVAEEESIIAETELKNYTGLSPAVFIHTSDPGIKSPAFEAKAETLYQQALETAPEIQQAEADIRSREYHLEAEKGERLPKLNLVGEYALFSRSNNYEDYYNRFDRNNYLLGLSVQFPVFDGFRTSARVAQSRQEVSEARYRLECTKLDLKLATQRGVSALRIARGAKEQAENEIAAVRESIRAGEALLQSGRISDKDFEEIKSQLFQKESARLEAEQVLFQRELELLGIIGDISAVFQ
jgi:outer membrane protein